MARTKQTARPKDIKTIKVARAELFGPSTDNPSGQLTLVPIGPSEPSEQFSFRSCISAPKVDSDSDSEEEVHKGVPSFISEQSEDNAENSDHGDSKPPKPKRKAKVTFDRPSGFVPGLTTVDGDQETTGVKMFIDPNNKKKIEDDWEELNRWYPLGIKGSDIGGYFFHGMTVSQFKEYRRAYGKYAVQLEEKEKSSLVVYLKQRRRRQEDLGLEVNEDLSSTGSPQLYLPHG
ncbi:hypothetical protein R1sor_022159 [Riccia sorocarpa]|uniref:Uncharacterized protein n=1 Tax=Riccia sorocarpa TaxID=122646 RepID=A0ABD3GJ32_9MARC